jgi:hypothetical protein
VLTRSHNAMDFKALIDFNKFTLALAAACFAYSLEKLVPMPTQTGRYLVLGLLAIFMLSTLCAVVLFAVATAALHRDDAQAEKLKPLISRLGVAHAGLLCIGLLVLGGMLVDRVLTEPPKTKPVCCALGAASGTNPS